MELSQRRTYLFLPFLAWAKSLAATFFTLDGVLGLLSSFAAIEATFLEVSFLLGIVVEFGLKNTLIYVYG